MATPTSEQQAHTSDTPTGVLLDVGNVSFYPVMGVHAARLRSGLGGAWRLYVLAKSLDKQGLGMVKRDDLRALLFSLGVSPRQWQRWITAARENDLVRDVQSQSGEWRLILPNPGAASFAMNCEVGKRKAIMPASALVGKGWRARVWAAYDTTFNGRPVSRAMKQKLVNVPVRTQRYRDVQAGTQRQTNFGREQRKDLAPMIYEYGEHKGKYITRDGRAAWQLPNAYFSTVAERGPKGRARKAGKVLAELKLNGSFQKQRALCDVPTPYAPIFHRTTESRESAQRKLSRLDHRVAELYEVAELARTGAQFWTPYGAT